MKKVFLLFCLTAIFYHNSFSQDLVSSEFLTSISKSTLESQYPLDIKNGVDLYKILYTTPDIHGALDTASGLLVVPDDSGFAYPLLCYQHGTVGSRWEVPSQLDGGYELAVLFGGLGYATTAADFLGLGEARGLHPYVHAETEASVAIDMLFAARQFADQNDFLALNDQLFVTGYSQGGHAAAAAHKIIQEEYAADFTVTASSPMSGPYSISEKMIDFTLGDEEYLFVAYIASTALSYDLAYDLIDNLDEFFKPAYVPVIQQYANEEITLWDLNTELTALLYANNDGQIKPKLLLQENMLDAILNDPTHPVSMALADNDLIDWVPEAPTRLMYCTADDQVTYQNAVLAAATMNANGASNLAAIDIDPTADHGGCVNPAVGYTALFFSGYQNLTVVTGDREPLSPEALVVLNPNPASDLLTIQLTDVANKTRAYEVRVFDIKGQLMYQNELSGNDFLRITVGDWAPGMYLLQAVGEEGSFTQKVMVD